MSAGWGDGDITRRQAITTLTLSVLTVTGGLCVQPLRRVLTELGTTVTFTELWFRLIQLILLGVPAVLACTALAWTLLKIGHACVTEISEWLHPEPVTFRTPAETRSDTLDAVLRVRRATPLIDWAEHDTWGLR